MATTKSNLSDTLIGLSGFVILLGGFVLLAYITGALGMEGDLRWLVSALIPTAVLLMVSKQWILSVVVLVVLAVGILITVVIPSIDIEPQWEGALVVLFAGGALWVWGRWPLVFGVMAGLGIVWVGARLLGA